MYAPLCVCVGGWGVYAHMSAVAGGDQTMELDSPEAKAIRGNQGRN